MSNIFVNLETVNDSDAPKQVSLDESRTPYILSRPGDYNVAIDRFSINKAWLPCFEDAHTLTLKLTYLDTLTSSTQNLNFDDYVDDNKLMYNRGDFITVLNAALEAACVALSLVDYPTFSLDHATGVPTLDYSNAIEGFASDYKLEFNEPLYSIFSSFPYDSIQFNQDFFGLTMLDSAPYKVVGTEDVNLSPVNRIFIKTSTIPMVYEFTPSTSSQRSEEAIITDFEFNGANMRPLNSIAYTATTGQYRFHTMIDGVFNRIRLEFYYKTFSGKSFELYFLPSGSISIKLLFHPRFVQSKTMN